MKNVYVQNEFEKKIMKMKINDQKKYFINKGTGAGGKNTNKNGLSYESLTNLDECYTIIKKINIQTK